MANYLGARPRFSDTDLRSRIEEVRTAVELVVFEHPSRREVLDTFVEVYREMDGDERTDGACHLLAAHSYVALAVRGVQSTLRVGEVGWRQGDVRATGSHSWVDVGGLRFDVAMGRPLRKNPLYEQRSVLGTTEIPTGRATGVTYDVPGVLDEGARAAAEQTIAAFMSGFRAASGIDFWFWVERTCRRMGVKNVSAAKLAKQHGGVRWVHTQAKEPF